MIHWQKDFLYKQWPNDVSNGFLFSLILAVVYNCSRSKFCTKFFFVHCLSTISSTMFMHGACSFCVSFVHWWCNFLSWSFLSSVSLNVVNYSYYTHTHMFKVTWLCRLWNEPHRDMSGTSTLDVYHEDQVLLPFITGYGSSFFITSKPWSQPQGIMNFKLSIYTELLVYTACTFNTYFFKSR